MIIPTEPIGSIPRPPRLIEAIAAGHRADPASGLLHGDAIRGTAFGKIRFSVLGTALAADVIAGR